jgi:hypothetical protein
MSVMQAAYAALSAHVPKCGTRGSRREPVGGFARGSYRPRSQVTRPPAHPGPCPPGFAPPAYFREVRWSTPSGPDAAAGTRRGPCESTSWKWWPGSESNQRHADFQSDGGPGSARASRRPGTLFRLADRTPGAGPCRSTSWAHRDRASSELCADRDAPGRRVPWPSGSVHARHPVLCQLVFDKLLLEP